MHVRSVSPPSPAGGEGEGCQPPLLLLQQAGEIVPESAKARKGEAALAALTGAERAQGRCFQRLLASLLSPCSASLRQAEDDHSTYTAISRGQRAKLPLFSCFGNLPRKRLSEDNR